MRKNIAFFTLTVIIFSFNRFSISEEFPEREKFLTPKAEAAIEKGLKYLARQQNRNGSFGKGGTGTYSAAVQSISLLAFLVNGHLPDLGEYGEVVKKGLNYLIDTYRDKATGAVGNSAYEHYFSVLLLSQVFGEYKRDDLQEILEKAVKLLLVGQHKNGGFGYTFTQIEDDETTGHCTAVEALRAAREAYMPVPKEVMVKAAQYVKRCANKDGGFLYRWMGGKIAHVQDFDNSGWTRTGLCVVALMACGEYDDPITKKGLEWLLKHKPPKAPAMLFPGYGAYYVAMALYQAGGKYWKEGYPALQDWLLKCQRKNGSFDCNSCNRGRPGAIYTLDERIETAFAVIALSFQKGLMPIFQR